VVPGVYASEGFAMKEPRLDRSSQNSKLRALDTDGYEPKAVEERMIESAESNAATERVLQRLSEDATPGGFVRDLQREMIEILGGRCSAQFKVQENVLSGGVIFADGDFVSDDSFFGIRDSDVPSWSQILANPRPTVFTLPNDAELIHELTLSFMKDRNFNWLVNFPLFVSGKPAWILAVLGDDPAQLRDANLDRFATLSRQLTLALQLNHLHAEASRNELARTVAEERTRLARDIHDTLAQGFAAICMRLQAAQRESSYSETPQAVRNQIAASLEISSSHLVHARQSIHSLRAESAEDFRLDEALKLTMAQMASNIPVVSRVQFPASPVPNATGLELLRIAQEALINAAKHSAASRIIFSVSPTEGDGIMIAIADNGRGFDLDKPGNGFGLIGIQERATRIQAQLTIASEPGAGTEVVIVWNPKSTRVAGQ
jgi:signal transduction histidine kinase